MLHGEGDTPFWRYIQQLKKMAGNMDIRRIPLNILSIRLSTCKRGNKLSCYLILDLPFLGSCSGTIGSVVFLAFAWHAGG